MKAKRANSELPYNTRNNGTVGQYHGSGIRGKVGEKKGGHADLQPSRMQNKGKPPTKMN